MGSTRDVWFDRFTSTTLAPATDNAPGRRSRAVDNSGGSPARSAPDTIKDVKPVSHYDLLVVRKDKLAANRDKLKVRVVAVVVLAREILS